MAVTQALTGSGGWPMSLFLTPELKPFYAGTYFPPQSQYGRPGFADLLIAVQKAWQTDPEDISEKGGDILARLDEYTARNISPALLKKDIFDAATTDFKEIFDQKNGGFGTEPKFPRPVGLSFLLRQYDRTKDDQTLDMVLKTLDAMADGGMYDHLGGGFHRYSVDGSWRVPHFEKMLYDQALLAIVYTEAFQVTGSKKYKRVAKEIVDYVIREMQDSRGGYYSALDADSALPDNISQHGEGAFYIWSQEEIETILGKEEAELFSFLYGVRKEGNAFTDPQREFVGKNILFQASSFTDAASKWDKTEAEIDRRAAAAREKLKKVRDVRPHPHLDDKVLTSWNGLMISAMAKAYQVFRENGYLEAAERAASFAASTLYDKEEHVLYHRYRDGDVGIPGNLDDYAFLVQGFLDLYEASFDYRWLRTAEELLHRQTALFADQEHGGFFDTSGVDKTVLLKMKSDYDGAEPAGNSVAALNFLRVGRMLANDEFTQTGEKTILAFANQIVNIPMGMPHMISSFAFQMSESSQIVIAGRRNDPSTEKMLESVFAVFMPNTVVYFSDAEQSSATGPDMSFLANMVMLKDKATAYVCLNYTCRQPTDDLAALQEILRQTTSE
jgi:hypothetical protein